MTVDVATLIAELIEAGTPAELVGRTAALLVEQGASKRSSGAERQARYRERLKSAPSEPEQNQQIDIEEVIETVTSDESDALPSQTVTGDACDDVVKKENPPDPLKKKTLSPKEKPPLGVKKKIGSPTATLLPDDWQVSEKGREFAENLGLSRSEISHEAAKFQDHWRGVAAAKARKRDWDAVWRNWLRRDHKPLKSADKDGKIANPVIKIDKLDPRWKPLEKRHRTEKGKPPLVVHNAAWFPPEWVDALQVAA